MAGTWPRLVCTSTRVRLEQAVEEPAPLAHRGRAVFLDAGDFVAEFVGVRDEHNLATALAERHGQVALRVHLRLRPRGQAPGDHLADRRFVAGDAIGLDQRREEAEDAGCGSRAFTGMPSVTRPPPFRAAR